MPTYAEYRPSRAEWLGDVPNHWDVLRFKNSILTSRNGLWGEEASGDDNDIICVRVADFDRSAFRVKLDEPTFRSVTQKERLGRELHRGNLLLEKSGGGEKQPVGAVVLFDHDCPAICSNFVARVELAKGMHAQFWCYVHAAAYAVRLTIGSINQTSGIQNLDQSRYFNELAPFPPLREQIAIAEFLDRETAKIDALVEEQHRLISLLNEKRQAVISHAVTKGLHPTAQMKDSGIDWLGEVPAHWDIRNVGGACERISYGFTNPMPTSDYGPFMLTANDIGDRSIRFESARRTTPEAFDELLTDKSRPQVGDVLVTKDGTLGRVAVFHAKELACINQSVAFLRPTHGVLSEFLAHALADGVYQARMIFEAGGTTIKHIYISRLAKMPFVVPPPREMQEIAEHCDDKLEQANALIDAASAAVSLLQERRAALISAAVTGKIDVRGDSAVKSELEAA